MEWIPMVNNKRRALSVLIGTSMLSLMLVSFGCLKPILVLGYLIAGPPSIEPDYETQTKKSMTDKDVKVAVVCYVPKDLMWDNRKLNFFISTIVANNMLSKKIVIIRPERVQEWLRKHSDKWDTPKEIGRAVGATHVVYIEIEKYTLYEKGNSNLHRGRAELGVTVTEIGQEDSFGEDSSEIIYRKQLTSQYPLATGRSTSDVTPARFQNLYLRRLGDEIGRLFYRHYNGDDISDAT